MDENILRRFIENPAQAVKLSQVGVITPVYSEGRVYAVNMGLPFCVFELPENELNSEDAKEYLDLAVEDIILSAAKAKEENKYFWYGKEFDYKKRLKSKRAKIAKEREEKERRRIEAEQERARIEAANKAAKEAAEREAAAREAAREAALEKYHEHLKESVGNYRDFVLSCFKGWKEQEQARLQTVKKCIEIVKTRGIPEEAQPREIAWEGFKLLLLQHGLEAEDYVASDITKMLDDFLKGKSLVRYCRENCMAGQRLTADIVDSIVNITGIDARPSIIIDYGASTLVASLKGQQVLLYTGTDKLSARSNGYTGRTKLLRVNTKIQEALKERPESLGLYEAKALCLPPKAKAFYDMRKTTSY